MKINRMLEIIIILITEEEVKAKDLAERFNCTTKTIYRDVEYIKEAGIPIISEKGRNGGFKIGAGVSKDKGRLSLKEQHAIINTLKDHGRISEEQLGEIMTAIEGLFKDDRVDWIDVDLGDPMINETFIIIKNAIYQGDTLEIKDNDKFLEIKPEQILVREDGAYIKYLELDNKSMGDVKINYLEIKKD